MANKSKQKKEKKKKKKAAQVNAGKGERVARPQASSKGSFIGMKWVRKAGMFLGYECFNRENKEDKFEWQ